jgi:hypothetical protein
MARARLKIHRAVDDALSGRKRRSTNCRARSTNGKRESMNGRDESTTRVESSDLARKSAYRRITDSKQTFLRTSGWGQLSFCLTFGRVADSS